MSTPEERLKILKMIQEGKISAEQGMQLLQALDGEAVKSAASAVDTGSGLNKPARWLRVRVTDVETGKTRVNVRLPIGVVTAGMKMGARFSPEVEGLDMDVLMQHIRSGETGKIVDVIDEEDGEHVEVFVE